MASNKVHIALGLLIWGFVVLFRTTQRFMIASFFVNVFGASLPDVDLLFKPWLKHRGVTHTIRFGLIYTSAVAIASSVLFPADDIVLLSLLAFTSFMSHLILDDHIKF
ncbi:MAG: metal-dependent hydrolase [Candidatus Diapherotrites archaeon]|nr:metal-dependent hydrolase [Candidatus Diapherotrites archaeon]